MSASAPLPKDHPAIIAWEAYNATDDYANTKRWAAQKSHADGSLWAAFWQGYLAASPSSPASGVRVKALEWPDTPRRGQRVHCSPLLRGTEQYCISHHGGDGPESIFQWARAHGPWSAPIHSYDEAKAAAQADYEARILSALGEHP